jgi:hypothetical protein
MRAPPNVKSPPLAEGSGPFESSSLDGETKTEVKRSSPIWQVEAKFARIFRRFKVEKVKHRPMTR